MHSLSPPTVPVNLSGRLLAAGYTPGVPPHVSPASSAIDRRVCCRLVCPECEAVGLDYRPFHKGLSYACVGVCRVCNHQEEV